MIRWVLSLEWLGMVKGFEKKETEKWESYVVTGKLRGNVKFCHKEQEGTDMQFT